MKELPSTWISATLGDLTEYVTSGSRDWSKYYAEAGALFVRTQDINTNKLTDLGSIAKVCLPANVEGKRTLIRKDDLLITITGANVGRCAHVVNEIPEAYVSQSVALVRLLDPSLSRFIHLQLLAPSDNSGKTSLEASAYGMGRPVLNLDNVRGTPLLIPPVKEQKRIADKLDTVLIRVDAVNSRLARVAPLLKRFRQSVLAAATSGRLTEDWRTKNPGGNATAEIAAQVANRSKQEKKEIAIPNLEHWTLQIPSEWTVASVHQFAECLDRLRVPIKKDQRDAAKGLYPYYGANGEVGRIDQFIFDDELVLVTEDETFYGREKPIAYRSSGKCWVNNHAHVLRCKSVPANDYLCFALMYYDVIPWLSGTTGRAKLTQQALLSLPIGAPPEPEQAEIVRRVETLFAFADRLEARLAQAQTAATRLTPALLAKAFRGELVPQDPNDEPAAELLRRLAQAPAAASPRRGRKAASATA
nr:restriction endonuclease subunit S [uncultured Rhodoferax sp.]